MLQPLCTVTSYTGECLPSNISRGAAPGYGVHESGLCTGQHWLPGCKRHDGYHCGGIRVGVSGPAVL